MADRYGRDDSWVGERSQRIHEAALRLQVLVGGDYFDCVRDAELADDEAVRQSALPKPSVAPTRVVQAAPQPLRAPAKLDAGPVQFRAGDHVTLHITDGGFAQPVRT